MARVSRGVSPTKRTKSPGKGRKTRSKSPKKQPKGSSPSGTKNVARNYGKPKPPSVPLTQMSTKEQARYLLRNFGIKKPKKVPTGYILFCNRERAGVMKDLRTNDIISVAKACAEKWNSLSDSQKAKYQPTVSQIQKHEKEVERYKEQVKKAKAKLAELYGRGFSLQRAQDRKLKEKRKGSAKTQSSPRMTKGKAKGKGRAA